MKKVYWKILLCSLLAIFMGISFAACGSDDEEDNIPREEEQPQKDDSSSEQSTANLIGYYSFDRVRNWIIEKANQLASCGDIYSSDWEAWYANSGIRIVDANTIYYVTEGSSLSQHGTGFHVYDTKSYVIKRQFYTLYLFLRETSDQVAKYVVKDNQLITSDGRTYTIGNDVLYLQSVQYTKVR